MSNFQIRINRQTSRLTYRGKEVELSTRCWWEKNNEIPAGRYTGCSKTKMSSRNLEGIYLPDQQTGKRGIFIHKGTSARASQGCFVIGEVDLLKIWNDIEPENGRNVTVIVSDGGVVV